MNRRHGVGDGCTRYDSQCIRLGFFKQTFGERLRVCKEQRAVNKEEQTMPTFSLKIGPALRTLNPPDPGGIKGLMEGAEV